MGNPELVIRAWIVLSIVFLSLYKQPISVLFASNEFKAIIISLKPLWQKIRVSLIFLLPSFWVSSNQSICEDGYMNSFAKVR